MAQKPLQHLYLALALLLTAGITASCADDLTDGASGTPIAFDTPQAVETRGVVDGTTLPESSSFKVWGGRTDYTDGLEFNGETVTESGGTWNYTGGTRYWQVGTYNFYALYPVDDVLKVDYSNGSITINNFDCSNTGEDAIDLMADSQTVTYAEGGSVPGPVAFSFRHLLARVTVSVRTGQGVTATVTDAELSGIYKTGDYNGSSWTTTGDTDSFTESYTGEIESNNTVSLFDDLLIIPQELSKAKLSITLTRKVENKSDKLLVNTNFIDYLSKWDAGRHYNYTLTVEPDAITFSNFTVDEWGETHTGGDINIDNSGEVIPTTAN